MATKVFISQPMRGKTDQEIIGERTNVRCFLTKMLKEPSLTVSMRLLMKSEE